MSDSRKESPRKSDDHIFIEPEVTTYTKRVRRAGGYPPTEVPHEEDEGTRERQRRGIRYWLEEVVTETKKKELRDETAYFVVDFRIKGDHPLIIPLLEKLQSRILTFLDKEKTKALVASEIEALDRTAKSRKEIPKSLAKIVFDIRPMRINEQIDERILTDETWRTEFKDVDIYVVPNIHVEKIERYVNWAKDFMQGNRTEIRDVLIDKFSKSGMLSVRTDFPTTFGLLQKSSFVYRVHATPKIGIQKVGTRTLRYTPTQKKVTNSLTKRRNPTSNTSGLPEVCVIDTGVNHIAPLSTLISHRSSEPNMPDDNDHDDHGTSVAYLVAYGEGNSPRARIISHKVLSGSVRSSLISALARAISLYLHRTRIFTCSINFLYDDDGTRFETWVMDRLIQASNACVLFSAGNLLDTEIQSFMSRGLTYPMYLDYSPVLHPSDTTSIVAVGSYCKKSNPTLSIAPPDSPSPFTRYNTQNNLMYDCVKPEIVEHGGNLNTNYSYHGVGVRTFSANGSPVEKAGTSLSTPIVAGHLAEVYEKYGSKIRNAETIKAIAYSSCERTQNHPRFVGFGKSDCGDMLASSFQSAKIIFEGEMRLIHPHLRWESPANKISVYVPAGVDRIELYLVHSDNYTIPRFSGLYTYIKVVPEKPARESAPPTDQGDLRGREHVKKLVWLYERGVKGFWTFTLVPQHIGIPLAFREKVLLRYGGVIKLTATRPRYTSLASEVRRNLKGKIR